MSGMATVKIDYVQAFRDRHGKMRYYFRRAGFARVSLPGEPGSREFAAAYQAALNSQPDRPVENAGSFGALVARYYQTHRFRNLKASTKATYRRTLENVRVKFGPLPVALLEPENLNDLFSTMPSAAAMTLRKRLISVLDLGVAIGWIKSNPAKSSEKITHKGKGFTAWDESDIAAFEARWPSGTRERLALSLLLYTGQRRSDVVRMGRQHVENGRIAVAQVKTGARLLIPIHPALKAEMDGPAAGDMTYLVTQYGAPFTPAGFTQWFRERAQMAGLQGLATHGLRKAAGRRLAEAGATEKEIAAMLGHESLEMVQLYTRSADQSRLADAAMARLTETPRERKV